MLYVEIGEEVGRGSKSHGHAVIFIGSDAYGCFTTLLCCRNTLLRCRTTLLRCRRSVVGKFAFGTFVKRFAQFCSFCDEGGNAVGLRADLSK